MNLNVFNLRRNQNLDPEDEAVEGERGITSVNKGLSLQARATNAVIIVGLTGLVGVLLYNYYVSAFDKLKHAKEAPKVAPRAEAADLPALKAPIAPESVAAAPVEKLPALTQAGAAPASGAPGASGATPGASGAPAPLSARELRLKRQLESPLSFKTGGTMASEAAAAVPALSLASAAGDAAAAEPVKAVQGAQASFAATKAFMLPDPTWMLTRGSLIPCTVLPALDTTLPGQVTCIQSAPVRGADGKVVLLEAGTKWVGQQGGGMAQGQNRVGIVWSRGETPNHVLVPVDSDGADELGRPGMAGVVNNHFWDRFGAAIALSLISDIGPYLTATHQGGGNNNTTIAFPSISGGAQSVMTEVLKSTIGIPSTLTKPQGAEIIIYLKGDIDFRNVYTLQEVR